MLDTPDTPNISHILGMSDILDTLDISDILVHQFVRYAAMMLQMLLSNYFTLILIITLSNTWSNQSILHAFQLI